MWKVTGIKIETAAGRQIISPKGQKNREKLYVLTKHEFFLGWGYTRNNCALRIKNMCIKGVSRAKGGGLKAVWNFSENPSVLVPWPVPKNMFITPFLTTYKIEPLMHLNFYNDMRPGRVDHTFYTSTSRANAALIQLNTIRNGGSTAVLCIAVRAV